MDADHRAKTTGATDPVSGNLTPTRWILTIEF